MAATTSLPPRSEIAHEHTWNAESVFATTADWKAEYQAINEGLSALNEYPGTLGVSPTRLADWLDTVSGLGRRVEKLYFYARMSVAVETTNQEAIGMTGQAGGLFARFGAAAAFADPEILSLGRDTVLSWVRGEERLKIYEHHFDNLFRKQKHVRSGEVEQILAMAGEPFSAVDSTEEMLTSADMTFKPATTSSGESVEVGQGNIGTFLAGADREARRTAWESYADSYLSLKNTLTSNYTASVKRDIFYSSARLYDSALEASLFDDNIPGEVFYNLIEVFKKNLPTWHKYWAVRRRALGVDKLEPYDIWAPIAKENPKVDYAQSVEWISEGLKPLGDDYVNALRQGCLQDRWVDIYPNKNKTAGAFSYGTYDTFPFILMSYDDTLGAMSTLAHELGHSMHSYLTRHNQPYAYGDYSLFVAEVASNFNQAMTRAHLFEANDDPQFQIALIEEAMDNIHRYFFIMPTLARFELEVHSRVERGEGITADDLINLMADLFEEGYGGQMHIDRERVGITWAQFGHLYANYYVFQYATGISAAHALSARILEGVPNAAEDYVKFLSTGSALYPVDALKLAGVDMATPAPVEKAFAILADYVERLDQLTR